MNTTKNVIQIHLDGVWAGSGKVDDDGETHGMRRGARSRPGTASDEVYEAISDLTRRRRRKPDKSGDQKGSIPSMSRGTTSRRRPAEQREQEMAYLYAKAHQRL